jgi:flagellar export protein FliJ
VKAFRFRVQAALDLRTRELGVAQRELAHVETLRAAARERLARGADALARARDTMAERMRDPGAGPPLEWYRFWMLGLDDERAACAKGLEACDAAVRRAAEDCRQARLRRESLDRLRQRLHRRHTDAQTAEERKLLDELGARRHTAARTEGAPESGGPRRTRGH